MIDPCLNDRSRSGKKKDKSTAEPQPGQNAVLVAQNSGQWLPAEDLKEMALKALAESRDISLDLSQIDHLDASALQILLALDLECKRAERVLHIENASPVLRQWFEYSGAVAALFPGPTENR